MVSFNSNSHRIRRPPPVCPVAQWAGCHGRTPTLILARRQVELPLAVSAPCLRNDVCASSIFSSALALTLRDALVVQDYLFPLKTHFPIASSLSPFFTPLHTSPDASHFSNRSDVKERRRRKVLRGLVRGFEPEERTASDGESREDGGNVGGARKDTTVAVRWLTSSRLCTGQRRRRGQRNRDIGSQCVILSSRLH